MNVLDKISKQAQGKININIKSLLLFASIIMVCATLFGLFSWAMAFILGFVYPLYASYESIESNNKKNNVAWLTYWIIYSFITFADQILYWIPFYYTLKLFVIIILVSTDTTNIIYKEFIVLLFEHKKIDKKILKKIKEMIKNDVNEYKIVEYLKEKIDVDNITLQLIINKLFQYTNQRARKVANIIAIENDSDSDLE